MINKALIRFVFASFVLLIGCITENDVRAQSPGMNWGIRLGLNAVSITNYEVYQAGEILTDISYTNKYGYLINAFARFNINRVFLQPELGWNNYRRACSFSIPVESGDNYYYPSIDLDMDSKVINSNFLVGYNIVNDYPFLFGVFVGSAFTGTYRTDFSMNSEESYLKTGLFLNYSGILGFSINISRIYFDLRYEISLPDANQTLSEIPDFPENFHNVKIKKKEAILSFSVGIMF